MHDELGKLRAEVHQEIAKVWNEIGKLRAEIQKIGAEIQGVKADLIKWMFALWVSQTLVIIGVIFALMRFPG